MTVLRVVVSYLANQRWFHSDYLFCSMYSRAFQFATSGHISVTQSVDSALVSTRRHIEIPFGVRYRSNQLEYFSLYYFKKFLEKRRLRFQ